MSDLINREDVIELVKSGDLVSNGNYKKVMALINDIPSCHTCDKCCEDKQIIDAEPVKHGEWVHEGVDYMTGQECWSRLPCFCSECKQETRAYFYNYCPNCGAKMDKGKKKNDE